MLLGCLHLFNPRLCIGLSHGCNAYGRVCRLKIWTNLNQNGRWSTVKAGCKHTCHIYIYIYVCVCVCVCVYLKTSSEACALTACHGSMQIKTARGLPVSGEAYRSPAWHPKSFKYLQYPPNLLFGHFKEVGFLAEVWAKRALLNVVSWGALGLKDSAARLHSLQHIQALSSTPFRIRKESRARWPINEHTTALPVLRIAGSSLQNPVMQQASTSMTSWSAPSAGADFTSRVQMLEVFSLVLSSLRPWNKLQVLQEGLSLLKSCASR